jgi:hypothetical protein
MPFGVIVAGTGEWGFESAIGCHSSTPATNRAIIATSSAITHRRWCAILLNKALVSSSIFLAPLWSGPYFLIIAALRLLLDLKQRFTDPRSVALRAFPGAMKFILMKVKATFSTFCRCDDETILGMFEAFQKVFNIFLQFTRGYFHVASDIGDTQRIIE